MGESQHENSGFVGQDDVQEREENKLRVSAKASMVLGLKSTDNIYNTFSYF